jgi:hypothetical protein
MRAWVIAAFASFLIAAAPTKKELARATALVDQAVALFRAERYIGAAELFLEAHAITDVAVQLRNAAKAFGLGGDEERAIEAWKKYGARRDISASERAEAGAELARIEEKRNAREAIRAAEEAQRRAEEDAARAREEAAAERAKVATSTRTTNNDLTVQADAELAASPPGAPRLIATTEPELAEERSAGPYYLAGGSVALFIAGAIVWAHSNSRLTELDRALAATDDTGKINGIDDLAARRELDAINTERDAATVVLSAGIGALATGTLWWLLDR